MSEQSSAVNEILENAAKNADAAEATKKVRKPKAEKSTEPKAPNEPKAPKAPKLVAQLDEHGNPVLDENGEPVMIPAPKKERKPRLDAEGNPIQRRANVFLGSQVLKLTDKGLKTTYRPDSKRGQIFASIKDGMTVDEFYGANGGKTVSHTFLVWFVNEAEVVDVE